MIPISIKDLYKDYSMWQLMETDDLAFLRKQTAVSRDLSRNNFIITPSDKGCVVFIIDSTHYNNKMMELIND